MPDKYKDNVNIKIFIYIYMVQINILNVIFKFKLPNLKMWSS